MRVHRRQGGGYLSNSTFVRLLPKCCALRDTNHLIDCAFIGVKNYSKDLERLAEQWVDACKKAPPTDPRFANLGSTVIATPLFDSLVDKWRYHMSSGRRNYNPATGECTASPCGATKQYQLWLCDQSQKEPIQQTAGPTITTAVTMTATATSTTPKRSTTVVAKSDTSSKPPPSASTNPLKAMHVSNYPTDLPIEEEDEGAEEGKDEKEEAEEAPKLIASMEITVETVKSSMNSQPHFVVNGAEMEEAENEKGVEEEDKEAGRTSESTILSPHLLYLGVIAIILLS
ncbi:hypothetical protein EGR_06393 [Echinococcus granulosus]|uniref:Uncharacterized protein n=1 Tax=Echinococcus granulosus TaxID=6210 RepID=W6UKV4_ECHGR|nr:hypothetical protein EGR_06393 [Echinococcus granulosus]EUB58722.1 hypothetical protein EGR_06393 [Echinococcus granulosus]